MWQKTVKREEWPAMKQCLKCNKQYDDTKMFCPSCGGQLTPVATGVPSGSPAASETWFARWGGTLLAVLGVFVTWEISWTLGLVLGISGAVLGCKSQNTANKVLSIIAAVVTGIMVLMFLPYL